MRVKTEGMIIINKIDNYFFFLFVFFSLFIKGNRKRGCEEDNINDKILEKNKKRLKQHFINRTNIKSRRKNEQNNVIIVSNEKKKK